MPCKKSRTILFVWICARHTSQVTFIFVMLFIYLYYLLPMYYIWLNLLLWVRCWKWLHVSVFQLLSTSFRSLPMYFRSNCTVFDIPNNRFHFLSRDFLFPNKNMKKMIKFFSRLLTTAFIPKTHHPYVDLLFVNKINKRKIRASMS